MRLLIFPAILFSVSGSLVWTFGDRLVFPEEFDDVVVWLRSHGSYAWAVGAAVILADAVLPVPSTPALFAMGIIYGPWLGGAIGGGAAVIAGLIGFMATRLLGERGALFLVGEKDLVRTRAFYRRWGLYAIVLGRALGGPAEWAVILAGLSKMRVLEVFGALCVGGFAAGLVMASLGAVAVADPLLATLLTAGVVLLLLGIGRYMARRTPANPEDESAPAPAP